MYKTFHDIVYLYIPTRKQNGGYLQANVKSICMKNVGVLAYLLDLIKQQQEIALEAKKHLPKTKETALFAYKFKNNYKVATYVMVSYNLKKICKSYNIKDEHGNIYYVTTHQFRHNGVTDREKAGFTLAQVQEMTGHKSIRMTEESYTHLNQLEDILIEPLEYTSENENPYVLFGGKIRNMDAFTETKILKEIRSHRLLGGLCTDVTYCRNGMWDCVACKNFIPDQEQLPYFEEQILEWENKITLFKNDEISKQNFTQIKNSFENIVKKIKNKEFECEK